MTSFLNTFAKRSIKCNLLTEFQTTELAENKLLAEWAYFLMPFNFCCLAFSRSRRGSVFDNPTQRSKRGFSLRGSDGKSFDGIGFESLIG